jgi:hypothetical protein
MKTITASWFKATLPCRHGRSSGRKGDCGDYQTRQAGGQACPRQPQDSEDIYRFLRGKGAITGDVISPVIENWGSLKRWVPDRG